MNQQVYNITYDEVLTASGTVAGHVVTYDVVFSDQGPEGPQGPVGPTGPAPDLSSPPPIGDVTPNTIFGTDIQAEKFSFDTAAAAIAGVGEMTWNDTDGTIDLGLKGGNATLQLGQELVLYVKNDDTVQLTDGMVVYVSGANGANLLVKRAQANAELTSAATIGVVTEPIATNGHGYIITFGNVRGINTNSFNAGDILYLSPTTAGLLTNVKPTAPNHMVMVGFVVKKSAGSGEVFVQVQNGYELDELHNVLISGVAAGQVLRRNAGNTLWENHTLIPTDIGAATAAQGAKADSSVQSGSSATLSGLDVIDPIPQIRVGSELGLGKSVTLTDDSVFYDDGLLKKTLSFGGMANEDRTLSLPDASGTLALTSQIPSTFASTAISDSTLAGRALLTAANAAAQRTSLGLGTAATQNTTAFDAAGAATSAVSTHSGKTDGSAHTISGISGLQTALDSKATLDGGGKIPSSLLPSYVDDVLEYVNLAGFPGTGEAGKIYVALDTNKTYRWSGSAYIEISPSPGTTDSLTEGSVNLYFTNVRAAAAAPVQSVAGKTGAVTLTYTDVGAAAASHTHTIANVTNLQTTLDNKLNNNADSTLTGVLYLSRPSSTSARLRAAVAPATGFSVRNLTIDTQRAAGPLYNENQLYLDGTTGFVGVLKNTPASALDVNGTITGTAITTTGADSTMNGVLYVTRPGGEPSRIRGSIGPTAGISSRNLVLDTQNGAIPGYNENQIYLDGSTGFVGIRKSAPSTALDVNGSVTAAAFIATAGSAPSSPTAGTIYFSSSDSHFYGYNGTTWKQLDN